MMHRALLESSGGYTVCMKQQHESACLWTDIRGVGPDWQQMLQIGASTTQFTRLELIIIEAGGCVSSDVDTELRS